MFIPNDKMKTCFMDVAIAIIKEGYSDDWYDALDMDNKFHSYYFTVPKNDDDIIITVETYSDKIVPKTCTVVDEAEWG